MHPLPEQGRCPPNHTEFTCSGPRSEDVIDGDSHLISEQEDQVHGEAQHHGHHKDEQLHGEAAPTNDELTLDVKEPPGRPAHL